MDADDRLVRHGGLHLPVQWLMPLVGWRAAVLGSGADDPAVDGGDCVGRSGGHGATPTSATALRPAAYAGVWRNPYFRALTPLGFSYGGMIAFQTLWAGPWMVKVAGLRRLEGHRACSGSMFHADHVLELGLLCPMLARRITAAG